MSDLIFSSVPGRLVEVLKADDAQTFKLEILDQAKGTPVLESAGITTGIQVAQRVAGQFQVTLDESLFAVPFGDEAGQMMVTLVHGMICQGSLNGVLTDTGTVAGGIQDGVQRALQWYKANKFQRSKINPVRLYIGASGFAGYIIGFTIDAQAAEGGMVRSQLSLIAWNVK